MLLRNPLLKHDDTVVPGVSEPRSVVNPLEGEQDHALKYLIIFLILGLAGAAWLSYALRVFHSAPSGPYLLMVGIAAVSLLVIFAFQFSLLKSARYNSILTLIEGAMLFSFLFNQFSGWFAVGYLLYVGAMLMGYRRAYAIVHNSMTVDFWHYSLTILRGGITAIALLLASVYVGLYQQSGGINFTTYRFVVSGAVPGLQYVAPNFTPETSIDALVNDAVTNYFAKNPSFGELSSANQRAVIAQATPSILDRIEDFTKNSIRPGQTVVGYTFEWLTGFLSSLKARGLGSLVIASIFLIIYLGVKSVMFVVRWPVLIGVFLIYELLKSIGVVVISIEPRHKEVLVVR